MTETLPEHVLKNRALWDGIAHEWVAGGERAWADAEPSWGIWHIPESTLNLLPDLRGKRAIELGCGTGYISAWMVRRGAEVVAIDNSAGQIATACRLQQEHGLAFEIIHGNAETVPCPDATFDFAISEYGAALWCDPYVWIPEAARLLKPGGRLVFLSNSPLLVCCFPDEGDATTTLQRPYFGMHREEWPDGGVEFHLPHSTMIRHLEQSGFKFVDLIELQAPEGSPTQFDVPGDWAHQWPSEDVWLAERRPD